MVSKSVKAVEKLQGEINYTDWKFAMRLSLAVDDLWDVVEKGPSVLGKEADEKAFKKICQSMSAPCLAHIVNATSAKQAWDNLQRMYDRKTLVEVFELTRELFKVRRSSFSSMEEYVGKVCKLSGKLNELGEPIEEKFLIFALLNGVYEDDKNLVKSIMRCKNLSFKTAKRALLLEESVANKKGAAELPQNPRDGEVKKKPKPITCHFCGEYGHIRPVCPKNPHAIKMQTQQPQQLLQVGVTIEVPAVCQRMPVAAVLPIKKPADKHQGKSGQVKRVAKCSFCNGDGHVVSACPKLNSWRNSSKQQGQIQNATPQALVKPTLKTTNHEQPTYKSDVNQFQLNNLGEQKVKQSAVNEKSVNIDKKKQQSSCCILQ